MEWEIMPSSSGLFTKAEIDEMLIVIPQRSIDVEMAKVCKWLKEHKYRCHVSLNGEVRLVKK
jgi:hypothetical protein